MWVSSEGSVLPKQLISCFWSTWTKKCITKGNQKFKFGIANSFKSKTMNSCLCSLVSFLFLHIWAQCLVSIFVWSLQINYVWLHNTLRQTIGCSLQHGFEYFPSFLTSACIYYLVSSNFYFSSRVWFSFLFFSFFEF